MREPSHKEIEAIFDKMAPRYDRSMSIVERLMFRDARSWAVSKARGAVLEIAVGTGLNLPLYGADVEHVTGVDLSEQMLAIARDRAAERGLSRVELRKGDVQRLALPDESVDTVVSTFTFCTLPDPLAASRQAHRVLRPGGVFLLVEHGAARSRVVSAMMRAVEPLTVRFGADHLTRDPVPYLESAGFTVNEVHRRGPAGVEFRVRARKEPAQN